MSDPAEIPGWGGARWITADFGLVMPLFRRALPLDADVAKAVIRVCGLGQFELRLNGRKVGEDVMEPAWSHYRKTCYYVTRDVTAGLLRGENVIGALIGNGMYNVAGGGGRYTKFKASFGPPKLLLHLRVDLKDGRLIEVSSDSLWRAAPGPITFSCIYGGEDHDARKEQAGWDEAGFADAASWHPVTETTGPGGALVEQISPPVRVMRTFKPAKVTEPAPGVKVFDLGQNCSGWPGISIEAAPAGTTLKLVTGELLDDAGRVTQRNTGKPVWFAYTTRGAAGGRETWHPRFSYTGFRYVEVADVTADAKIDVSGDFVHSAAEVVGKFECSNDLLNRIHALILAAIRSNMQSVLTDCPHREKLGWLEESHLMGPAIMYNFAVVDLYRKISRDMRDAQHDNGCVPTIAPQYTSFKTPWDVFNDSPEWGSAIVINPWLCYQQFGDRTIVEENYDAMKRYVAYLAGRADADGIIAYGLSDWYDIGPGDPGFCKLTTLGLTATATYFQAVLVMCGAAVLLGRNDDATRYAADAHKTRAAFNRKFFDAAKRQYDTGSQTANAMPLALGIVEGPHRDAVLDALVRDIRARDNHITAGDIGFRYVLLALSENGRNDVIYDLLTRTDAPSYGYQLAQGATALTEAWDANRKSSHNHFMLGHAEAWFYDSLAGIRVDLSQPPPRQIQFRPAPVGDVAWARASYRSALGDCSIQWERGAGRLRVTVEIPHGAAATVHLPGRGGASSPQELDAGRHEFDCEYR